MMRWLGLGILNYAGSLPGVSCRYPIDSTHVYIRVGNGTYWGGPQSHGTDHASTSEIA